MTRTSVRAWLGGTGLWMRGLVALGAGLVPAALVAEETPPPAPPAAAPVKEAHAPSYAADPAYQAKLGRTLSVLMPRTHLLHLSVDDEIARRALDLYIDSLDFDHTYFLAGDVEEFRARAAELDDAFKRGDLTMAFTIFNRFRDRVRNRTEFSEAFLKQMPDLERKEVYLWKRKDAPWAANEAEWDRLWQSKLKHEFVTREVGVQLASARNGKEGAAKDAGAPNRRDAAETEKGVVQGNGEIEDLHLGTAEFIRKRFTQFKMVIDDYDEEFVVDRYVSSFTQAYDPHSSYMSPASTEDFDINMSLSLSGIGAQLVSEDGAAKITRIIPGGPVERDGRLKVGDRIVAVGEPGKEPVDILHWPLYKAVRKIRGPKGSTVHLVVWPASDISGGTEKRVELVRDEIKLEESAAKGSVREFPGPDGKAFKLGVLTLPEFYADFKAGGGGRRSSTDVRRILGELKAKGVDGIAFDLRNNGGGSLPDAIEIAGLFIHSGPVVQVKDARGVQVLGDPDPEMVYDGPLVVMCNRMSASASEIVAAALQDYGRAVIVGDSKTHGKGSVQSVVPMDSGNSKLGSLKVTTAAFYRIAGGSTQMKGVISDLILPSVFDTMEMGEEFLPHALPWTVVDSAFYATLVDQFPPLADLRKASESRRAADDRFKVRADLLKRLGERINAKEITLRLSERLTLAKSEKELDDLMRASEGEADDEAEDGKEDEEKKFKEDLVLQESLKVLADIVAWKQVQAPAARPGFAEKQ